MLGILSQKMSLVKTVAPSASYAAMSSVESVPIPATTRSTTAFSDAARVWPTVHNAVAADSVGTLLFAAVCRDAPFNDIPT